MKWISVEDRLPAPDNDEVEIAFWDGVYMCRIFGAYDYDKKDWYVSQGLLVDVDTPDWKVTHWREPEPLPEPPEDK